LEFCDKTLRWNCEEEEESMSYLRGCVGVILAQWIFFIARVLLIFPNQGLESWEDFY
jgi:hypothetical protein